MKPEVISAKYKVGDKVKVKTVNEIKDIHKNKIWNPDFITYMEEKFKKDFKNFPDRIVEISEIVDSPFDGIYYKLKNCVWHLNKEYIAELVLDPITSRFEILDL